MAVRVCANALRLPAYTPLASRAFAPGELVGVVQGDIVVARPRACGLALGTRDLQLAPQDRLRVGKRSNAELRCHPGSPLPLLAIYATSHIRDREPIVLRKTRTVCDDARLPPETSLVLGRDALATVCHANHAAAYVRPAGRKGRGLFARALLPPGTVLGVYPGRIVPPTTDARPQGSHFRMAWMPGWDLDPSLPCDGTRADPQFDGFLAHMANEPSQGEALNCEFVTRMYDDMPVPLVELHTTRWVEPMSELLVSYGPGFGERDY